jgi:hypothetical protein
VLFLFALTRRVPCSTSSLLVTVPILSTKLLLLYTILGVATRVSVNGHSTIQTTTNQIDVRRSIPIPIAYLICSALLSSLSPTSTNRHAQETRSLSSCHHAPLSAGQSSADAPSPRRPSAPRPGRPRSPDGGCGPAPPRSSRDRTMAGADAASTLSRCRSPPSSVVRTSPVGAELASRNPLGVHWHVNQNHMVVVVFHLCGHDTNATGRIRPKTRCVVSWLGLVRL